MEKLFLGSFLAGDELDVVKDQDVDVPEFSLKFVHLVPSQEGDCSLMKDSELIEFISLRLYLSSAGIEVLRAHVVLDYAIS